MTVKDLQSRIKASAWQAIAKGDVALNDIPRSALEPLVDLITDTALLEVDNYLEQTYQSNQPEKTADEMVDETAAEVDEAAEDVLWRGRPFLSIGIEYIITSERVRVIEGLLGKSREDIELVRIQDIDQSQTFRERMFNLGDIILRSHDSSNPTLILNNIKDPQRVHEILRRAVLKAREKYRLYYREQM